MSHCKMQKKSFLFTPFCKCGKKAFFSHLEIVENSFFLAFCIAKCKKTKSLFNTISECFKTVVFARILEIAENDNFLHFTLQAKKNYSTISKCEKKAVFPSFAEWREKASFFWGGVLQCKMKKRESVFQHLQNGVTNVLFCILHCKIHKQNYFLQFPNARKTRFTSMCSFSFALFLFFFCFVESGDFPGKAF